MINVSTPGTIAQPPHVPWIKAVWQYFYKVSWKITKYMVYWWCQTIIIYKNEKHNHKGILYPFLAYVLNLIKCKFHRRKYISVFRIDIVWRLSEFAFLVRLLRWPHFFYIFIYTRSKLINDLEWIQIVIQKIFNYCHKAYHTYCGQIC